MTSIPQPVLYQNHNTFTTRDRVVEVGIRSGVLDSYEVYSRDFESNTIGLSGEVSGFVDLSYRVVPELLIYGSAGSYFFGGLEYILNIDSGMSIVAGANYGGGSNETVGDDIHYSVDGEEEYHLESDVDSYSFNVDFAYEYINNSGLGVCIRPGVVYNMANYFFTRYYTVAPSDKAYIDKEQETFGLSLKVGLDAGFLELTAGGVITDNLKATNNDKSKNKMQRQIILGAKAFF